MVEKFTSENFEEQVLKSSQVVLVDFYADWCVPCKMLAPAVEAAAEKFAGQMKTGKLNLDENLELAQRYGVQSIPTLILFKDGQEAGRTVGMQSKDAIENFVKAKL
ncbi:MAG: thioredoxin [Lachnospiraceae bacterium]|jgi:thioredoxin 1|nr:thioredoxin [Lachnospiraceae bacterium]